MRAFDLDTFGWLENVLAYKYEVVGSHVAYVFCLLKICMTTSVKANINYLSLIHTP